MPPRTQVTVDRRLPPWTRGLHAFEAPSPGRAAWQLVNTLVPYLGLLGLMAWTVKRGLPYGVTLALAVPAAAFMLRLFILFHDCVHGSFTGFRRADAVLGTLLGVLVFTPFEQWGRSHRIHHATSGDLDRRGAGDVRLLTVAEYRRLSPLRRWLTRLERHPLVMFGLGPLWVFLIVQRVPTRGASRRALRSVLGTNLALVAGVVAVSLWLGLDTYLRIQLPVLWLGGMAGVWLFFVQHQFEPSYWRRNQSWSPLPAALEGSSHYALPPLLAWLSGHIGLHHIHHLRPRIPNYRLQACLEAIPELRAVPPLTIRGSLRSLRAHLWDEEGGAFVTFAEAWAAPRRGAAGHHTPAPSSIT